LFIVNHNTVSDCRYFSNINISQGSVATRDGIFSCHFTANLPLSN